MTRVLVTGVAGCIGSQAAEALLARGDEVVGIDNFDPSYARASKERNLSSLRGSAGFEFVEMDVLDTGGLGRVLTGDAVVLHLAAKAGFRPSIATPLEYTRTNVLGTQSVLEAARLAGVSRVVFGSSSSVYGNDTPAPFPEDAAAMRQVSPYGASKRAAELLFGALAPHVGIRGACLRFFTVYGPRQRPDLAIHAFARQLAEDAPITLFGDGLQTRDYTYVGDIVAGVLAAIDWTGSAPAGVETFNIGSGSPLSLMSVVEELADAMNVVPRIRWAPRQPGDVLHTCADLSKSGRMLGYSPRTRFPDGIRQFVAWFEEAYARQ